MLDKERLDRLKDGCTFRGLHLHNHYQLKVKVSSYY